MGHIKQSHFFLLIIGTVGLDIFIPNDKKARERLVRKRRQTWRKVFHAGILIEPHIPELEEFKEYFNDAIRVRIFLEVAPISFKIKELHFDFVQKTRIKSLYSIFRIHGTTL